MARKGGVKRMSGLILEEMRGHVKKFLESTLIDAVEYTGHSRRKTVSTRDVVYALKNQGHPLFGFGS
jgi:histone H4